MAGTLVGRYELEFQLGHGAMGEVWRGRDLATRQPVAVKLVQLANIDDQARLGETIARFRREADTLARLRHPNIISAVEAGRVGSDLFMVMELAEGMSMEAMLRQRQANGLGMFPVESVLRIAKQACSGLAAAHAIGVVHRDIKPSNLMVSARGHLTIVDFGIARLLEDNSPRLTAPTQTIGSPLYMSPEQTMGIDVDGRSDLYSFGCVLYELLAGRPPFVAEMPIAVMRMHLEERPVPIRNVRSDLPNGLPELVDRLLEKERDARPPDAGYVLRSLVGISDNVTGSAAPEHEADRRTFLVGAADTVRGAWPPPPAGPVPETYRATLVADDPPQWPGQGSRPEGKGKRRGNGGPDGWPAARPRRRRRRWTGLLSSVLTVAIVAGIAGYVWNKSSPDPQDHIRHGLGHEPRQDRLQLHGRRGRHHLHQRQGRADHLPVDQGRPKPADRHGHRHQRPAAGPRRAPVVPGRQGNPPRHGDLPGLHAQCDLRPVRLLHLHVRLMNVSERIRVIECVPLAGRGLVARRGGLVVLSDGQGPGPDPLLAALDAVADSGGDGAALVRAGARAALERGGRPAWACAGVTFGGEVAVFAHGEAAALVSVDGGPETEVTAGGSMTPVTRTLTGAVVTVRLVIGATAAPDPRLRLDAGIVFGGGVMLTVTQEKSHNPIPNGPYATVVPTTRPPAGQACSPAEPDAESWFRAAQPSRPTMRVTQTDDARTHGPPEEPIADISTMRLEQLGVVEPVVVDGAMCARMHFNAARRDVLPRVPRQHARVHQEHPPPAPAAARRPARR